MNKHYSIYIVMELIKNQAYIQCDAGYARVDILGVYHSYSKALREIAKNLPSNHSFEVSNSVWNTGPSDLKIVEKIIEEV